MHIWIYMNIVKVFICATTTHDDIPRKNDMWHRSRYIEYVRALRM